MRYIQAPDSPRRPFGDLIEGFWPGVHHAYDWNWVTLCPDAVYAKHRVGTIPTNRISLTHSRYGLGGWMALHMHPDHDHAYYVIGGEGLFQTGGEQRVLGSCAAAYVPAGTLHGHRQFGGGPVELLDIHALTTVLGDRAVYKGCLVLKVFIGPWDIVGDAGCIRLLSEALEVAVTDLDHEGTIQLLAGGDTESAAFIVSGQGRAAVDK